MSKDIENLVRQRYRGDDGWLVLDEVADGPGFGAGRRLDLVAVGCWASKALHVIGFEVKRSVADWRRELDQPHKREPFIDEVNEFVFVAPWKVIDPKEVPEGCGLLSMNDAGDLRMRVRAKQVKSTPSPAFLTALFRAALRQAQKHERSVRHFAEFQGRSLSYRDISQLVEKATGRILAGETADFNEHRRQREQRQRESRAWGDVLSMLFDLGRELLGEARYQANRAEIPKYAAAVRAGIAHVRAGSHRQMGDVAKELRRLANLLSYEEDSKALYAMAPAAGGAS